MTCSGIPTSVYLLMESGFEKVHFNWGWTCTKYKNKAANEKHLRRLPYYRAIAGPLSDLQDNALASLVDLFTHSTK